MARVLALLWNTLLIITAKIARLGPLRTLLLLYDYGACDNHYILCTEERGG